jgi:hypothetical protein
MRSPFGASPALGMKFPELPRQGEKRPQDTGHRQKQHGIHQKTHVPERTEMRFPEHASQESGAFEAKA